MKEEKVFIEKFNDFDIYYDKEKERFVADKEDLDRHFEASKLWEIKGSIKETRTEEINQTGYMKTGYFGDRIAKVTILTRNTATKRAKYKILEDTEKSYDTGRIQEEDTPKTYPINDANTQLYTQVKALQQKIEDIKEQQQTLVKQLK